MWKDVYEEFSELTKSEQIALFEAMKQDLFPEEPIKLQNFSKRFVKHDLLQVWLAFIVVVHLLNVMGYIEVANAIYVRIAGKLSMI